MNAIVHTLHKYYLHHYGYLPSKEKDGGFAIITTVKAANQATLFLSRMVKYAYDWELISVDTADNYHE